MLETLVPMLPPFVGKSVNETLGWLSKATEQEVVTFYSNLDNYPISRSPDNYGMLMAVVAQRAAELEMDIVLSPGRHSKHHSETTEEQLQFESLIEPPPDDYKFPPDEEPQVPSARFTAAIAVASKFTKAYGDGRDSPPGSTPLVILDDSGDVTISDVLNLSWVFLHLTTVNDMTANEESV